MRRNPCKKLLLGCFGDELCRRSTRNPEGLVSVSTIKGCSGNHREGEIDVVLKSLKSMVEMDARTHNFKGKKLSESSGTQLKKSEEFQSNSFLALTENITQRLVGVNDQLNPNTWPSEEDNALFGDSKVL